MAPGTPAVRHPVGARKPGRIVRCVSSIAAATLILAGQAASAGSRAAAPRTPWQLPRPSRDWSALTRRRRMSSHGHRFETAGPFFLADVRDKIDGRWGASWLNLYPLHQQLVSQADFVTCENSTPFPAPLHAIRVLSVRPSSVKVPGLTLPVPGVALDVRLEIAAGYGPRDPIVLRHTFKPRPRRRTLDIDPFAQPIPALPRPKLPVPAITMIVSSSNSCRTDACHRTRIRTTTAIRGSTHISLGCRSGSKRFAGRSSRPDSPCRPGDERDDQAE